MSTVVYITTGGIRFHEDADCLGLAGGLRLAGGRYSPQGVRYKVRGLWSEDAARAGFTACRVCVPPALALPATGETYGHRPIGGLVDVCARCTVNVAYWLGTPDENDGWIVLPTAVAWPCTSAVVLGLAPHVDPL